MDTPEVKTSHRLEEATLLTRYPKEGLVAAGRTKNGSPAREKERNVTQKGKSAIQKERRVNTRRQGALDATEAEVNFFRAHPGWSCPEKLYQRNDQQRLILHQPDVTIITVQVDV